MIYYLPRFSTVEQLTAWAEARGLVAKIWRGPDGLLRGLAVPR